jgi:hypothetical protein
MSLREEVICVAGVIRLNQLELFVEQHHHLFLHDAKEVIERATALAEEEMLEPDQVVELIGPEPAKLIFGLAYSDPTYVRKATEPMRCDASVH